MNEHWKVKYYDGIRQISKESLHPFVISGKKKTKESIKDSDANTTGVSTGFESSETENSLITENNETENLLIKVDKTDNSLIIANKTDNLLITANKTDNSLLIIANKTDNSLQNTKLNLKMKIILISIWKLNTMCH